MEEKKEELSDALKKVRILRWIREFKEEFREKEKKKDE